MKVIVKDSYGEMSAEAARLVAAQVLEKPNCVLGFATGSTPLGMYKRLIEYHQTIGLDFSQVRTFNLDEYVGLAPENEQSYHYFMQHNLFRHINIRPENTALPNGMAADLEAEGARYEAAIKAAGGIDLQVLGIGHNAHIGFNEPSDRFNKVVHTVNLNERTINANSRFFDKPEEVPRRALSMGIGSIMRCRNILLLASGVDKADAVANAVMGDVMPQVSATILQFHPSVTFIVDTAAAQKLPIEMRM